MRRRIRFGVLIAIALTVALVLGFAGDGRAERRKTTVLMTEHDDVRAGEEGAKQVEAQMGVLDDAKLNAYVTRIGKKLLRGIPRRSFHYEFKVVDQWEPNAFALPGGYIFISRGLIALANDEDELANVIGHEITHAARRHAAARQGLARRQSPLRMGMLNAAHLASYGRDMEREADKGGQILAAAAGYDPKGMSTFLRSMGQMERYVRGAARRPTFFDTHPGAQERAAANAFRAKEIRWKRDPSLGDTRVGYLERIRGIPLGERPEGGMFQGDSFIHPDMDFHVRFPRGWQVSNGNTVVGAMSPHREAAVFLTADRPVGDPEVRAKEFVEREGERASIAIRESQGVRVGSFDAWRLILEAPGQRSSLAIYATFIPYGKLTWQVTGMVETPNERKFRGRILNTSRSFRPLTAEERASLRSTFLEIVTARSGEDLTALGRRSGNIWDPTRTAVSNGLFSTHRFSGGEQVKIARRKPYTPKRATP